MAQVAAPTSRTVSAVRDPAAYRQSREALTFMHTPAFLQLETASRSAMAPLRDAYRPVFRAHEQFLAAFSPSRALVNHLLKTRRELGHWWARINPFEPTSIKGLEEQLAGLKRRSIEAAVQTHVHLRALLAARCQQDDSPGKTVAARPQVARGPNNRRLIDSNPPAGLLRV